MLDCDERNEMRERGENDDRCHGSGWTINGESIRMTDPKKRKRDLAYGIVRFWFDSALRRVRVRARASTARAGLAAVRLDRAEVSAKGRPRRCNSELGWPSALLARRGPPCEVHASLFWIKSVWKVGRLVVRRAVEPGPPKLRALSYRAAKAPLGSRQSARVIHPFQSTATSGCR